VGDRSDAYSTPSHDNGLDRFFIEDYSRFLS
jgi:hypothetical protein